MPGDQIYAQHVKNSSVKMFNILKITFNACLRLGYFQEIWKMANICMILKPGKKAALPTSYRPISLLPILGKLFEKIMTVRITKFFIQHDMFNKFQYGFRKGK